MFVSPEIAEVLGVLIGDGCLRVSRSGRSQVSQVAFTGSASEFWYYEEFIQPNLEFAFGVTGRLYLQNDNTTRYHIVSSRLVVELSQMGIPIGKKHDASIPPCVTESGQVIPFIRGIYHAEGSIYRRYSKRYKEHAKVYGHLLNIQIRMKLRTLMRQIHEEINKLGVLTNRLTEKAGVYTLRITRQVMVRRFIDLIEPRYKTAPHQANL